MVAIASAVKTEALGFAIHDLDRSLLREDRPTKQDSETKGKQSGNPHPTESAVYPSLSHSVPTYSALSHHPASAAHHCLTTEDQKKQGDDDQRDEHWRLIRFVHDIRSLVRPYVAGICNHSILSRFDLGVCAPTHIACLNVSI